MRSSTQSVVIHAPAERVYTYLDDPEHQPEFWPGMIEVTDVKSLPSGGHSYGWKYKIAGIRLEGTDEDVEHIPNERLVTRSTSGIDTIQTWTLQQEGADTKVTLKFDYTVPVPVLGKLAEAVFVKVAEHEGDEIMANLKTLLEAA